MRRHYWGRHRAQTPAAGATTCRSPGGVQIVLVSKGGHATPCVIAHDRVVDFDRKTRVKRSLGLEDTVGALARGTAARVWDHGLNGLADTGYGGNHGLILLAGGILWHSDVDVPVD